MKFWIPGPQRAYGTTPRGFQGEIQVVRASDYDLVAHANKVQAEEIHALRKALAQSTILNGSDFVLAYPGCPDCWRVKPEDMPARAAVSAVQPERCCVDYPRCDCNSPPEPDNAPALQPCGHPWKAQQDRSQMLMAELTPDATKAMNMRANGERPWSFHDSFDVCRNDRLLLLQHSDALSARLAEAETNAEWAQHWKDKHDTVEAEIERLRAGLQLIADDKNRLMNEVARQTAASILGGKPIGEVAEWPKRDVSHAQSVEEQRFLHGAAADAQQVPEGMALYKGEFVTARMVVERLAEAESAYLSAWARLVKEERLHGYAMEERDHAEEMADKLADAIATLLGVEIGEHSNMNCPWEQALEAFEERAASTVTQEASP